ncbi:MAG TPA: hypothetical protein VMX58_06700, partial [Patescibacteria group bacterium]|nr:hypothetical protein [Patescibacteria group bacterium]
IRPVFVMSPAPGGEPGGEATRGVEKTPGFANPPARGDAANSSSNVETKCTVNLTSDPGRGSKKSPSGDITETSCAGEPERVVLEQRYNLEFSVNREFMENLNKIRALLSTKHPKGVGFEKLFDILMTEYLEHHGPENRIKKEPGAGRIVKTRKSGR